jgi:probable selenium-dependent hydroxylase accessory protein YqeC
MLADLLGVGDHELVAFIGAGGKSTLLLALGLELVEDGYRVALTTTTKMGADQIPPWAMRADHAAEVGPALAVGATPFLVGSIDETKIVGVDPGLVDAIFSGTPVDHVLVEADGARGRKVKAPGPREPVIPNTTSLVVAVASLRSVGERIADVAHRPERVAAVLGRSLDYRLEPEDIADVVGDAEGGLARVPQQARVAVALTGLGAGSSEAPDRIRRRLENNHKIDRVVVIPDLNGRRG